MQIPKIRIFHKTLLLEIYHRHQIMFSIPKVLISSYGIFTSSNYNLDDNVKIPVNEKKTYTNLYWYLKLYCQK